MWNLSATGSSREQKCSTLGRNRGWQVAAGVVHWRTFSAPSAGLRLILVGRNPYSHGYCVTFAAGSNRDLAGINDLSRGSSSYYVFQESQLLREGYYDRGNEFPERPLSKTDLASALYMLPRAGTMATRR